ncbi:hypothetical protein KIN20_016463 [Parelaphostrongylus tenuis]|uniref:Uncharacterized protein n=1 Tax=Parelaphostrongylus tenuis TaxID=148309 RepID=A0AAD5MGI0_PARTN|nr:hypothetical protein KIN20_016463 [Parelaphostrongylus tenuis]
MLHSTLISVDQKKWLSVSIVAGVIDKPVLARGELRQSRAQDYLNSIFSDITSPMSRKSLNLWLIILSDQFVGTMSLLQQSHLQQLALLIYARDKPLQEEIEVDSSARACNNWSIYSIALPTKIHVLEGETAKVSAVQVDFIILTS